MGIGDWGLGISQDEEYYKPGETELFSGKKEEKKKKFLKLSPF